MELPSLDRTQLKRKSIITSSAAKLGEGIKQIGYERERKILLNQVEDEHENFYSEISPLKSIQPDIISQARKRLDEMKLSSKQFEQVVNSDWDTELETFLNYIAGTRDLEVDSKRTKYLEKICKKMDPKNIAPCRVYIMRKGEEPSAFVLADGSIFINQALLNLCETEDDVAFILGHEMGHIKNRTSIIKTVENAFSGWGVEWIHESLGADQESVNFLEQGNYKVSAAANMQERVAGFNRDKVHQSGVMRATQTFGNFAVVNRVSSSTQETPLDPKMRGKTSKTNLEICQALVTKDIKRLTKADAQNLMSKLHPQDLQKMYELLKNAKHTSEKKDKQTEIYSSVANEIIKRLKAKGYPNFDAQVFVCLMKGEISLDKTDGYFIKINDFPTFCASVAKFNRSSYVNEVHKSVFIESHQNFMRYPGKDYKNEDQFSSIEKIFQSSFGWSIYDTSFEPNKKGIPVDLTNFLNGLANLHSNHYKDNETVNSLFSRYFIKYIVALAIKKEGFVSDKVLHDFFNASYHAGYYFNHDKVYYTVRNMNMNHGIEVNGEDIQITEDVKEKLLDSLIRILGIEIRKTEHYDFDTKDIDKIFSLFEIPEDIGRHESDQLSSIFLKMSSYWHQEKFGNRVPQEFVDHVLEKVKNFKYKIGYSFETILDNPFVGDDIYFNRLNLKAVEPKDNERNRKLYGFSVGLTMLIQMYSEDSDEFYESVQKLCRITELNFNDLSKIQVLNLTQELLLAEQGWAGIKTVMLGKKELRVIDFTKGRLRISNYQKLSELPFVVRLLEKESLNTASFAELNAYQKKTLGRLLMFNARDHRTDRADIFQHHLIYLILGQDTLFESELLLAKGVPETEFNDLAKFMEQSYPHNVEYQKFVRELDRRYLTSKTVTITQKIDHLHSNLERVGYDGIEIVAEQIEDINDFRYLKSRLGENVQDYLEGNDKLSLLAMGEFASQVVNGKFEDVFMTAIKDEQRATESSTKIAAGWFKFVENYQNYNYHKIQYNKAVGKYAIERSASNAFVSINDTFERLQSLSEFQRFSIALKLLVDVNGGLSSPENRKLIGNIVVKTLRLENDFMVKAIYAACTEADPKLASIPIAQTIAPTLFRILNKNKIDIDTLKQAVIFEGHKYINGEYTEVRQTTGDLYNDDEITNITTSNTRSLMVFGPEYVPYPNSAIFKLAQESDQVYYKFNLLLSNLVGVPASTNNFDMEPEETNEIGMETEAIIKAVESSGPLGGRSLQLTRQFERFSEAIDKRLSKSFDRNKGMDKFRFWLNLDKLAHENPEIESFVQMIKLKQYKGGGSLQTTYRADYYTEAGVTDVVIRMKNPNVELFVDEVYKSAYKTMEKVEKEAKNKETLRYARMGMMLLDLSRQWCKADVNDMDYEKNDDIFRVKIKKFNDRPNADTQTFTYAPTRILTHKQVKVETTGLGETVNQILVLDQTDSETKRRAVKTMSEFLVFQLENSDFINEAGEEIYILQSDPHIGNYLIAYLDGAQIVGVLDRDFYLHCKKEDVKILKELASDSDSLKFASNLVERLMDINKIRGLQRNILKANIFLKSGIQSIKDTKDKMAFLRVLLTELDRANINTPLELRLGIRNIEAARRLNEEFGMDFSDNFKET